MFFSKLGIVEKSVEAHTGAVLAARWCGDYIALVSGVCMCICVFHVICIIIFFVTFFWFVSFV